MGVVQFWGSLGLVARGLFPFWLLGGGLVMVGAGLRARRPDAASGAFESSTRLLTVLGLAALAAAAACGLELDLGSEWTAGRVSGYLALGLASGVVGGMLGLGGGVVHLSGMTLLFGFPFAFARGATLINNVFINAAAAAHYRRDRLISSRVVSVLLPASLVGVTCGSFLQNGFDESAMRQIFGVFMLLVTVAIVFDTVVSRERPPLEGDAPSEPLRHGVTGVLAGFLSGILGISGGVVAVPGQTLSSSVPLRSAIANSTLTTSISSALSVLLLFVPGAAPSLGFGEMATIAVLFIPGNLLGGHLGARWMGRLPLVAVRTFFIAGLLAISIRAWVLAALVVLTRRVQHAVRVPAARSGCPWPARTPPGW